MIHQYHQNISTVYMIMQSNISGQTSKIIEDLGDPYTHFRNRGLCGIMRTSERWPSAYEGNQLRAAVS